MPARRVRYKQNHPAVGFGTFGEMMMSEQTLAPAREAAREIAAVATANQRASELPYEVDTAVPPVVLGPNRNPRVVAHVVGVDPLHAVEEFGSGTVSEGATAGKPRPQGGHSPARRTLAKAGDTVIPLVTRTPE